MYIDIGRACHLHHVDSLLQEQSRVLLVNEQNVCMQRAGSADWHNHPYLPTRPAAKALLWCPCCCPAVSP